MSNRDQLRIQAVTASAHASESSSCETNSDYLKDIFVDKVASVEEIALFLTTTDLYSDAEKRWTEIPDTPELEKDLYKPLCDIFKVILEYFNCSTRTVIDLHAVGLPHIEGSEGLTGSSTPPKTSPDITIKGSSPIFGSNPDQLERKRKRENNNTPDYWSCVSVVEVKTEKNRNYSENLAQIAVYVQQCFIQQKNRHFVHGLIVTEQKVQLFHFDRSGVLHHTVKINIHEEAATFVRIVLGICSDDGAVGFDTSIYGELDKRCLRTLDENQQVNKVTLSKRGPLFYRRTIRGRDDKGRVVIIKDAWRSKDRSPELELLKKVKGLKGVGQILGWEEDELTTAKLRGFDHEKFVNFRDRILSRITMEAYGQTINHFQSREELIYVFRDAVAGHQNLWNAGILHRDVSINNVLIGKPDAEVGNRGVLIDMDMAILLARKGPLASVDFRTGTRAFQSISALSSDYDTTGQALAHDHLDDLESFFYVLCWITIGYAGPDNPLPPLPPLDTSRPCVLREWDQNNERAAAACKKGMMIVFDEKVTPYFGPTFQKLLFDLHQFLWPHILEKMQQKCNPKISRKHLLDLTEPAKAHYAAVLGIIDQAIMDLESETPNAKYTTPTPVTPTPITLPPVTPTCPTHSHSHSDSSCLKRQGEEPDMIDEGPKSKKQKQQAY